MTDRTLHFRDGILVVVGANEAQLVDLSTGERHEVARELIGAAERLALGTVPAESPEVTDTLVEHGFLENGPQGVDDGLHRALRDLDQQYSAAFEASLTPRWRSAHAALLAAHATRKRFRVGPGCVFSTPETCLRRALLLGDAEVVGGKHVLCVGDDNLISVGLASLGHEVTVWDIDTYLVDLLTQLAADLSLTLRACQLDLRDPLPTTEIRQFDAFFASPFPNPDSQHLFVSRGLSCLSTSGSGFVAVPLEATRSFTQLSRNLGTEVVAWHQRHDRYYSSLLKLHAHESDWVKLKPGESSRPLLRATDGYRALDSFRDEFTEQATVLLSFLAPIDEPHYAKPLFLDLLMQALENKGLSVVNQRAVHSTGCWSALMAANDQSRFTLHVDRLRRQLLVELSPCTPQAEATIRDLLLSAYKSSEAQFSATITRDCWEIRVQ